MKVTKLFVMDDKHVRQEEEENRIISSFARLLTQPQRYKSVIDRLNTHTASQGLHLTTQAPPCLRVFISPHTRIYSDASCTHIRSLYLATCVYGNDDTPPRTHMTLALKVSASDPSLSPGSFEQEVRQLLGWRLKAFEGVDILAVSMHTYHTLLTLRKRGTSVSLSQVQQSFLRHHHTENRLSGRLFLRCNGGVCELNYDSLYCFSYTQCDRCNRSYSSIADYQKANKCESVSGYVGSVSTTTDAEQRLRTCTNAYIMWFRDSDMVVSYVDESGTVTHYIATAKSGLGNVWTHNGKKVKINTLQQFETLLKRHDVI